MKVKLKIFFSSLTRLPKRHRMWKERKEEIAMARRQKNSPPAEIAWEKIERTLTLEETPVLSYTLSVPQITGGGLGGRWINAYYTRLSRAWQNRWEREVYWKACLELASRQSRSKDFIPWSGQLDGTVTWQADGLLSIRMEGEETHGDGRPCRVRWGDTWNLREGTPCPLKEFFRGRRSWKKDLYERIFQQGRERRAGGDCFLDQGWENKIKRACSLRDFCLTQDGVELALPQCLIAPAAEGNPVFFISLP